MKPTTPLSVLAGAVGLFFCLALVAGCDFPAASPSASTPGASPTATAFPQGELVEQRQWQNRGRSFSVVVEKHDFPAGAVPPQYTVKIIGEAPVIKLVYPGEVYSLDVQPDKVLFSGHTFELTDDADVYRIDGSDFKLGRQRTQVCLFVAGRLVAVY